MTPPTISPDTLEALKRLREVHPMPWRMARDDDFGICLLDGNDIEVLGVDHFSKFPGVAKRKRALAHFLLALSQDPNLSQN